jgi:arylsulfatase A-like enzyme
MQNESWAYWALIWLVALLSSSATLAANPAKPNVIVIFSDDHGWADLGANGSRQDVRTPNLDALASGGVRFTRGYVTAPQCVPSRAGLLTGRYQQRFGVDHNLVGPLPLDAKTIAHRMAEAGYKTGMVGKWHLDVKMEQGGAPKAKANAKKRGGLQPLRLATHLPHRFGFQEMFCGERNRYSATHELTGRPVDSEMQVIEDARYRVDVQTDAALSFIDRHAAEPFFLYLAYYAPHVPSEAPEKYLARFADVSDPRRVALAMISSIDDGVGQIRQRLEQHGVDRNTLIFFMGDNGAPLKSVAWNGSLNDPLVGEKGMVTDGGLRVPFLASWPNGLPAGAVYEHAVSSLDILPTALAASGNEVHPAWKLDGVNLLPFLKGQRTDAPHAALFWRFRSQAAVLAGEWKLVFLAPDSWWLFNTTHPDGEKAANDRSGAQPEKLAEMKRLYSAWSAELKTPGLPTTLISEDKQFFDDHVRSSFIR